MRYTYCGSSMLPADKECKACGRTTPTLASSSTGMFSSFPSSEQPTLYGAGGWLLFFIFTLVFFGPIALVLGLVGESLQNIVSSAPFPHWSVPHAYYIVAQFAHLAIRGYGIYAGIQLWKIRPKAVQHAKGFLLLLLAYAFANYSLRAIWTLLMTSKPVRTPALAQFVSGPAAKSLLEYALSFALWYAYLLKSRRVRATFPLSSTTKS